MTNNCGVDKGTAFQDDIPAHGYTEFYEPIMIKYYNKHPRILEVGVMCGDSLRMWNEYFDYDCDIVGFDLRPELINSKNLADNIEIIQGDQMKDLSRISGEFDIIIDDGLHSINSQFITLYTLYKKCRGIYILEDLHTNCTDFDIYRVVWNLPEPQELPNKIRTNTPLYFLNFMINQDPVEFNDTCLTNEQLRELRDSIQDITIHSRAVPDETGYLQNFGRSVTSIITFKDDGKN